MGEKLYQDESWLRTQYIDKCRTTDEMAELAGCTKPTILRYMDKFGIERRDSNYYRRKEPPKLEQKKSGHIRARATHKGTRYTVSVHQLVAIAHGIASPKEVFGDNGIIIHHENEVPWDNRPENLKAVSRGEHVWIHRELYGSDQSGGEA